MEIEKTELDEKEKRILYKLSDKAIDYQKNVITKVKIEIEKIICEKDKENFLKSNSLRIIKILRNPVIFYEGEIFFELIWKEFLNLLIERLLSDKECIQSKLILLPALKNIDYKKTDYSFVKIDKDKLAYLFEDNEINNNFKIQKEKKLKKLFLMFLSSLKYKFRDTEFFKKILNLNTTIKLKVTILKSLFDISYLDKNEFEILQKFLEKFRFEELLSVPFFMANYFKNKHFNNFDDYFLKTIEAFFIMYFNDATPRKNNPRKKTIFKEKWIFEVFFNMLQKDDVKLHQFAFDHFLSLKNTLRNSTNNNNSPLKNYEHFAKILFDFSRNILKEQNSFYKENKKKVDEFVFSYFLYLLLSNNYNVKKLISLIYLMEENYGKLFADFLEEKIGMIFEIEKISNKMLIVFMERILWVFVKFRKNEVLNKLKEMALKFSIKDKNHLESQIEKIFRIIAISEIEKENNVENKKKILKNLFDIFIENHWVFFSDNKFFFKEEKNIVFEQREIEGYILELKNLAKNNDKFLDINHEDFYKKNDFLKSFLKIIFNKNHNLVFPVLEKIFEFDKTEFFDKLNFSDLLTKILLRILIEVKPSKITATKLKDIHIKILQSLLKENNQNYLPLCLHISKKIIHYSFKNQEVLNSTIESIQNCIKTIKDKLQTNSLNLKEELALVNLFVFNWKFANLIHEKIPDIIKETFVLNKKIFELFKSNHSNIAFFSKILNLVTNVTHYYEQIQNNFQFIFEISKSLKFLKKHQNAFEYDHFRTDIYKLILQKAFKFYYHDQEKNIELYFKENSDFYADWYMFCVSDLKSQKIIFFNHLVNGFNNGKIDNQIFFEILSKIMSKISELIIYKNDNETNELIVPINDFLSNISMVDNYFFFDNLNSLCNFWRILLNKNIDIGYKINIVLRALKIIYNFDLKLENTDNEELNSYEEFLYHIIFVFNNQENIEALRNSLINFMKKNKSGVFGNISFKLILSVYLIYLMGYNIKNTFKDLKIDLDKKYENFEDLLKKNGIVKEPNIIVKKNFDLFKIKQNNEKGIQIFVDLNLIKSLMDYIRIDLQEEKLKSENEFLIETLFNDINVDLKMTYSFNNNIILNLLLQICDEKSSDQIYDYIKTIFESRDEKWNRLVSMLFFQVLHLRLNNLLDEKYDDLIFLYIDFLSDEFKIKHFLAFFEIQQRNNSIGFISPFLINKIIKRFATVKNNKEKIIFLYFYEYVNPFWISDKKLLEEYHTELSEKKFATPNSHLYFLANLKRILKNYCNKSLPCENYLTTLSCKNPDINIKTLLNILQKIEINNSNYEYFLEILLILNSSEIESFRFEIRKSIFLGFFDFFNKKIDNSIKNLVLEKLSKNVKMMMTEKEIENFNDEIISRVAQCNYLQAKLFLVLLCSKINALRNDELDTLTLPLDIAKKVITSNDQQIKKEFLKYITLFYFFKPMSFYEKYITYVENKKHFDTLELEVFYGFFISLQNKGWDLLERYMNVAENILNGDYEEQDKKFVKAILSNYTFLKTNESVLNLEGFKGDFEKIKNITDFTKTEFNYFA